MFRNLPLVISRAEKKKGGWRGRENKIKSVREKKNSHIKTSKHQAISGNLWSALACNSIHSWAAPLVMQSMNLIRAVSPWEGNLHKHLFTHNTVNNIKQFKKRGALWFTWLHTHSDVFVHQHYICKASTTEERNTERQNVSICFYHVIKEHDHVRDKWQKRSRASLTNVSHGFWLQGDAVHCTGQHFWRAHIWPEFVPTRIV